MGKNFITEHESITLDHQSMTYLGKGLYLKFAIKLSVPSGCWPPLLKNVHGWTDFKARRVSFCNLAEVIQ